MAIEQSEPRHVGLRELSESNLARFDARLSAAVAEMRHEVLMRSFDLQILLEQRVGDLIKWSCVLWAAMVAAIVVVAAALR